MENVELCFQWRVRGSAQHQPAVELEHWDVHESPFRWLPRSLTCTVNDRKGELILRYCRNRSFI